MVHTVTRAETSALVVQTFHRVGYTGGRVVITVFFRVTLPVVSYNDIDFFSLFELFKKKNGSVNQNKIYGS